MSNLKFEDLKGKTIKEIEGMKSGSDRVRLVTTDNVPYIMWHSQSCCESVSAEEVIGDPNDLLDSPVLLAEEVSYDGENPEGVKAPEYQDSFTWTFYKLSTIKGSVTIRWYGESNGYYGESGDFEVEGRDSW